MDECIDLKAAHGNGPGQGVFTLAGQVTFITDSPEQEGASSRDFGAEGLDLNYVGVVGIYGISKSQGRVGGTVET